MNERKSNIPLPNSAFPLAFASVLSTHSSVLIIFTFPAFRIPHSDFGSPTVRQSQAPSKSRGACRRPHSEFPCPLPQYGVFGSHEKTLAYAKTGLGSRWTVKQEAQLSPDHRRRSDQPQFENCGRRASFFKHIFE